MRRAALIAMTAVLMGNHWHVEFTPREAQFGIVIVTECKVGPDNGTAFYQFDQFPLFGDESSADVRKAIVPRDDHKCTVVVQQLVATESGEEIADGTIVLQEE